jgi:hypothetical protein
MCLGEDGQRATDLPYGELLPREAVWRLLAQPIDDAPGHDLGGRV